MTVKDIFPFGLWKKQRSILLIILAFLVFLGIYLIHVQRDMSDFGVYYRGGQRILKGETLYRLSDGILPYKYSPTAAVFFFFLTFLPYGIAKFIWYFSQIFILFLVLSMSYDILPSKQKKKAVVLVLSFLVLLKFLAREIELGQVNIFIILLLLLMVKSLLEREELKSGMLWGFSLYFKPYALVFLPYFLLKKRIRLVASCLGMLVLGLVLPVVFYGFRHYIKVLKDWPETLSLSTPSLLDQYDNASLHAFFLKNLPAEQRELAWILIIFMAFIIGFFLLWMMLLGRRKRLKEPEVLEFSYLFILIPLLSPLVWYYNYLYSVLAVVLLINSFNKFSPALKCILIANLAAIGASLVEVMGHKAFRFYTQHSLVVVSYLLILAYLFYSRIKCLS